MKKQGFECPVCGSEGVLLDVVDLNKSCEEQNGKFLPLTGVPVYYALCEECAFCWAPELYAWPLEKFEELIYNAEYVEVDPDYQGLRPRANATSLQNIFPNFPVTKRHLDYGGGNGMLSGLLRASGWNSASYDPFVDKNVSPTSLGKFDLISAFEVFEHVPDVKALMSDLCSLLADDGMVLFSTMISDGNINKNRRLGWWYASPRNGHISLFSKSSLTVLAQESGFNFGSFSHGAHLFFKTVPPWAKHIINMNA